MQTGKRASFLKCLSILVFLLLTVFYLPLAHSGSQLAVSYDGDVFPESSNAPFIRQAECDVRSISEGTLNIVDTYDSDVCTRYFRNDPLSSAATIELTFRVKVNSAASSYPPPNRSVAAGFYDGVKNFTLGISETSIAILEKDGFNIPGTENGLDTKIFHIYRIVKNADQFVEVYVDGNKIFDFPYASLPDASRLNESKQFFGATSTPGVSNTEWDYVHYTITNPNAQPENDGSYEQGYQDGTEVCAEASANLAVQQATIETLEEQILTLQTENQAVWAEGYESGEMDGRTQCIDDPAGCDLYNEAQVREIVSAEVDKVAEEIIQSLPRGIIVSLCKHKKHRSLPAEICNSANLPNGLADHHRKAKHEHRHNHKLESHKADRKDKRHR
jgi:hypothetical protein